MFALMKKRFVYRLVTLMPTPEAGTLNTDRFMPAVRAQISGAAIRVTIQ
jgi:hypothetical protein